MGKQAYSNGIQTIRYHLCDIVLGDPRLPVLFECSVRCILADALHTSPFTVIITTAHIIPLAIRHPFFDDE